MNRNRSWYVASACFAWLAAVSISAAVAAPPDGVAGCYTPISGGWAIRMTKDPAAPRLKPGSAIGVVIDDARQHRRPLYPPADRALVWSAEERAKRERTPFRPLVLAANDSRLLVDLDSAGGLSGHAMLGLTLDGGASKWLHQWSEIDVRYVEGRMEYVLRDATFPGVVVRLQLAALADSVGFVLRVAVEGMPGDGRLVWTFGGATGLMGKSGQTDPALRYAPKQCADNTIRWAGSRFSLQRKGSAGLHGRGSWTGDVGLGAPEKVVESPAALCAAAKWLSPGASESEVNRVAVGRARLGKQGTEGWLVVGTGGKIETWLGDPAAAQRAALARNGSITSRIVVRTPDPYLNQAMPMIALTTDGLWADASYVHGAWSWRNAYLGWRGWYGPVCYGWTDRVRLSIERHATLGLIGEGPNRGALASMLEAPGWLFYNMDEVFLDQVRQYFEYTNDLELMRRIYPVLEGIVQWESLRLQPENASLYESSLDTWISDSHFYTRGQCTTASAYMLAAHRFLADLAARLGKDPEPWRRKADAIRQAMQEKLWMPRRGVFAECRDTLGRRQLHPEPELPTIYHSAEFEAASPLQVYQMLHWADTNLKAEPLPAGGKTYWSSNWAPNAGRTYTHSTHEMAYAEELNLALTNYLAGRAEEGYSLLVGGLCGIYNGLSPGGLSCDMDIDGRQRRNHEFADANSMWGRAVVEGLFGIVPKRPDGYVQLSPQFPAAWQDASIETPHFAYAWKREGKIVTLRWKSPVKTAVRLRLPLAVERIEQVSVNGKAAAWKIEPGAAISWLCVETPADVAGTMSVQYVPAARGQPKEIVCKEGDRLELKLADYQATALLDPQHVLDGPPDRDGVVRRKVVGEAGQRLVFLESGTEACPTYLPLRVRIEPKRPIEKAVWSPPKLAAKDLGPWSLVDLSGSYNAAIPDVLPTVAKMTQARAAPALGVNHRYWREHIVIEGAYQKKAPSDAAWRAKIGPGGVGWTHDGIPFKSPKEGKNIAVVTRAGGFPTELEIPVRARGKSLYLMLSGITFPAQSHVVNLRITLEYEDGARQAVDLVNPFDIGDCWSDWCGRWHDTAANGFENLGGRFGPPGSAAAGDLTRPIAVDTEAHLVRLPLQPDAELRKIRIEAFANDLIFGLMGASVLK